jgi:RNA polymerase sigma factor (sigma-70 family)
MANPFLSPRSSKRPVMVAMVLGTALTTLNQVPTLSAQSSETTQKAITDINRYCTTCWRNARLPADAWGDCTQEVFRRLLERLPDDRWAQALRTEGEERRELVRAIDAVKKRTQRVRKWSGSLEGLADRHQADSQQRSEKRDLVQQTAQELLTSRQQRILQMSFEGWSVHEIAQEMNLAAERVSDEKYKAIRKLRAHLTEEENRPAEQASVLSA